MILIHDHFDNFVKNDQTSAFTVLKKQKSKSHFVKHLSRQELSVNCLFPRAIL